MGRITNINLPLRNVSSEDFQFTLFGHDYTTSTTQKLGPELQVNGDFSAASGGWYADTGAGFNSPDFNTLLAIPPFHYFQTPPNTLYSGQILTVGRSYLIQFTINSISYGGALYNGSTQLIPIITSRSYSYTFTATDTYIWFGFNNYAELDNVSIMENQTIVTNTDYDFINRSIVSGALQIKCMKLIASDVGVLANPIVFTKTSTGGESSAITVLPVDKFSSGQMQNIVYIPGNDFVADGQNSLGFTIPAGSSLTIVIEGYEVKQKDDLVTSEPSEIESKIQHSICEERDQFSNGLQRMFDKAPGKTFEEKMEALSKQESISYNIIPSGLDWLPHTVVKVDEVFRDLESYIVWELVKTEDAHFNIVPSGLDYLKDTVITERIQKVWQDARTMATGRLKAILPDTAHTRRSIAELDERLKAKALQYLENRFSGFAGPDETEVPDKKNNRTALYIAIVLITTVIGIIVYKTGSKKS